jgi:hypothetical protein
VIVSILGAAFETVGPTTRESAANADTPASHSFLFFISLPLSVSVVYGRASSYLRPGYGVERNSFLNIPTRPLSTNERKEGIDANSKGRNNYEHCSKLRHLHH